MTSSGSPYSRFKRALRSGNLTLVRAAAAELPRIGLPDALAICVLMAAQGDARYDRAATRWLARLALDAPTVGLEDLRAGSAALDALPLNADAARGELRTLCERHALWDSAAVLAA